mmetsp:Transcript_7786/g.18997  ORF Transcript_7786/g.18997 Transcript_7786/m.18997 type:complete len:217 (-) Transcript_7786:9-659(-)
MTFRRPPPSSSSSYSSSYSSSLSLVGDMEALPPDTLVPSMAPCTLLALAQVTSPAPPPAGSPLPAVEASHVYDESGVSGGSASAFTSASKRLRRCGRVSSTTGSSESSCDSASSTLFGLRLSMCAGGWTGPSVSGLSPTGGGGGHAPAKRNSTLEVPEAPTHGVVNASLAFAAKPPPIAPGAGPQPIEDSASAPQQPLVKPPSISILPPRRKVPLG